MGPPSSLHHNPQCAPSCCCHSAAHGGQVVCEVELAARVFRSWGQHADAAAEAKAGAVLAGGQMTLLQTAQGLPPFAASSEIEEVSFSGAPVPKGAATNRDQCSRAYSNGEVIADGRCVPLSQQQPRRPNDGGNPASAPSHAATAAPPSLDSHAASSPHHPMGVRTWGGLPLTSLADASEGSNGPPAGGASAHRLGLFRFKGSPETLSMVNVVPASLAGRR